MHMQVHRTKAQTLKKKSERKKEKKIIRGKTVQFDLLRSPSHALKCGWSRLSYTTSSTSQKFEIN